MATSETLGEIRYPASWFGSDFPCDTPIARDAVAQTALHKADMAAQVRGAWVAPSSSVWAGDADRYQRIWGDQAAGALLAGGTGTSDRRWYMFDQRAAFAPKVRADGSGYRLRVRIAGASSDGDTVDFAVVVGARIGSRWQLIYGTDPVWPTKFYSGITSTSAAWLTPDDGNHYFDVPSAVIDDAFETWATLDDLSGDPVSVSVPQLVCIPIAQTRSATAIPHCYGFYVAETIGT